MRIVAIQLEPVLGDVAANRLRGRVDLVVGGSCWWSIPAWPPAPLTRRMERANARTATTIAQAFARLVGAPVAHAAHAVARGMRDAMEPVPVPRLVRGRRDRV